MLGMPAQKLSIALEEPVAVAAKRAAQRRGISLSAWLNEASRSALTVEDGLIAVAEWEAEHGPLPTEDLAAASAALDAAGIGRGRERHRAA
jgi:hypothetical protein